MILAFFLSNKSWLNAILLPMSNHVYAALCKKSRFCPATAGGEAASAATTATPTWSSTLTMSSGRAWLCILHITTTPYFPIDFPS